MAHADPRENQAALGLQLHLQGKHAEAAEAYRRHLAVDSQNADVHYNLALVLQEQGQFPSALAHYDQALLLRPKFGSAAFNRGNVLASQGRQEEAIASYRLTLENDPRHERARLHLAHTLGEQGRLEEAADHALQLLETTAYQADAFSFLLYLELFRVGRTIEDLAALHEQWDLRFARQFFPAQFGFANIPDPERRLRVGLLSADLGTHAVSFCITPILEAIDPARFEMFAYSNRPREDGWKSRIARCVGKWHDVSRWDDDRLAAQIREDRIDILLDLSGHTSGKRILALARKPAPVQISWIGHPFPTHLKAIDYHLADRFLVPDEHLHRYGTPILRMETCSTCYEPPKPYPEVGPPPVESTGRITFGSFNKPTKINAAVIGAWSHILKAVPESRLLLKFRGFGDPSTMAYFRRQFAVLGVNPERIEFEGPTAMEQMLRRYGDVDIGLDPFPYTGATTTMLAAWMGVPVVTWPGETIAARQSLSALRTLGREDLIAANRDEYIRIAVELAHDRERLAALRRQLRPAFQTSSLCDGRRVADQLEAILRDVWRRWCLAPR